MGDKTLNASEALYGFAGWLTSREVVVVLGANYDAAIAADLVDRFIRENNLPEPRYLWHKNLKHPKEEMRK